MTHQQLTLRTTHSGSKQLLDPTIVEPIEGRIDVWFLSLAQDAGTIERARTFLNRDELARADRFIHERDAERNILAHGLMRHLLAEATGQHPENVQFKFGKYKKPFLAGEQNVQFNLSDTKDALIIAMTEGEEIGADIETMERKVDHNAIADHYFTEDEKALILNDKIEGKRRFLELWTKKEAILKATGVGIMDDLKILDTSKEHIELSIQHPEFCNMAAPEYFLECFELEPTHIISVASSSPVKEINVRNANGVL